MEMKKAQFAKLCNVSRVSVGELCASGKLTLTPDGKIDLTVPRNLAYLAKHNPQAAIDVQAGIYSEPKPTEQVPAAPKERKSRKSNTPDKAPEPSTPNPTIGKIKRGEVKAKSDDVAMLASFDEQIAAAKSTGALSEYEIGETLRKPLYDAQKAKAEAQLKAVALDKEHGSLGELEAFDSFITELWQSIQRNMLDVITKQSALVCKRLGTVGKELEVIDVLESDMKKRMDNVAREVQSILQGKLSHKVTEVPAE